MSVKIQAAVVWEPGAKLSIEEVDLDEPREDEILVSVEATGVCHTDESRGRASCPSWRLSSSATRARAWSSAQARRSPRVKAGDRVLFTPDYCGTLRAVRPGQTPYCEHAIAVTFTGTRRDGSPRAPGRTAGRSAPRSSASPRSPPTLSSPSGTSCPSPRRPAALPGGADLRRADRRGRDAQRDAGSPAPVRISVRHRRGRTRRGDGRGSVGRATRSSRWTGWRTACELALELGATQAIDTTARELADVSAEVVEPRAGRRGRGPGHHGEPRGDHGGRADPAAKFGTIPSSPAAARTSRSRRARCW